jgi:lysine-N-methylase
MAKPIRALPVIQNWDCHACGNCCTDYVVPLSEEERARLTAQGWDKEPGFENVPIFVRHSPWWQFWRKRYRLNQRAGDRCVFLDDKGLCRIHAKFGYDAKPFACRLYPYILVPMDDHWRVSLRYACPSAAANKGRPLEVQTDDLKKYAQEMETWDETPAESTARPRPEPLLQAGQCVGWKELDRFIEALIARMEDRRDPIPRRWLRMVGLARTCQEAKFDKLAGSRLREFLDLVATATDVETPRDLAQVEPPGWIGRVLFRTTLAVYLRKDSGLRQGVAGRGRLALVAAMARMARGVGRIPELQKGLPDMTFAEFEHPLGPLTEAGEEALRRYYVVKLRSGQFFGPPHYHFSFWEGVAALALTLPAILWLARGYQALGATEAIHKAITVIDENFGYNPLLGQIRQRLSLRILLARGELDRLIAWYGR